MNSSDLRELVEARKVILAIRNIYGDELKKAAEIFISNGIYLLEVTFDQADKDNLEKTQKNIQTLKSEYGNTVCIGAGTVMSRTQAEAAKEAGAQFVLAPDLNREVLEASAALDLPSVPGAFTPTEIREAWEYGASLVKLFPAGDMGVGYCKSISAPLNHIPLLPMGGVDAGNVKAFLKLKNVIGVGISSAIADKRLIQAHDWIGLDEKTRTLMEIIRNGD